MSEESITGNANYITGLQQEVQQYEAGLLPPIPEPPQTFVVECNKTLAQQDGDALRTNAWTNSFPPIKLKKGDVVSVNSAFLSTRGSGDLLQFDDTNNKTRILFEYYATNDNANNKKPAYNIKGFKQGAETASYKSDLSFGFMNCYPVNYRPMPLYRLMETWKERADYPTLPLPATIQFTDSTQTAPFNSTLKESFWGYKQASDYIYSGVEDKYIPGLFRNPVVNIRETLSCAIDSTAELDPTTEPFFGFNIKDLRVWYVSTPMSKYGACSDNSTMRIYFAFSQSATVADGGVDRGKCNTSTFNFLRNLRIGEIIQFKDADWVFGLNSSVASDATGTVLGGSKIFYCSGYASCAEGVTVAEDTVDKFTQMGTPFLTAHASGVDNIYYDMTLKNPLGQMLKITKINACNDSSANKAGAPPVYKGSRSDYTDDYFDTLPYIEVQCDNGISICVNNCNQQHPQGVPSMGHTVVANSPGDSGQFARSTTASLQMAYRTWYAGSTMPLTTVPKITNATANVNTIYRNTSAIRFSKPYPQNPHTNEGLNETLYLAFRPYFYSVGGDASDSNKNLNTAYSVDLREDRMTDGGFDKQIDFYNNVGITAGGAQYIVAHNYNTTCLNKDGTLALTSGHDITETPTYGGGRTPHVWHADNGFDPIGYDTPVATATRIGFHNQGQSFHLDASADNVAGTGGFFASANINNKNVEDRTSITQQGVSPNGNLYIENQLGLPTRFFFTFDIIAGAVVSGLAPDAWDITESGRNVDRLNGVSNYMIGAMNLPQARYKQALVDGGFVTNVESGLWYGYSNNAAGVAREFRQPHKTVNGFDGLREMRYIAYQMPTLTYARFTNQDGDSEVMYIKIQPYPIVFNPTLDSATVVPATQTTIQPNLINEFSGYDRSCAVAMYIIKRDCENTGTKSFRGTAYQKTFDVKNYDPYYVQNSASYKPTQMNNFFEILNDFAMAEHQVEFDELRRDLIPTTASNFTSNPQYQEVFGDLTKPIGTPCGGDFYLCKYPNMPFNDSSSGQLIRRVCDNQIRLTTENIKSGNPTRLSISNYQGSGHTGKYEWGKHYDYVDVDISGDKVYYSPSDIANVVTNQLHKSQDIYKSWDMTYGGGGRYEGGYWKHSAGNYPMNSLFRTIHGPSLQKGFGTDTAIFNEWDASTGYLKNEYHEGDFCFFADIAEETIMNGINAYAFEGGKLGGINEVTVNDADKYYYTPASGKHPVWIQNNDFFINNLPTTDFYTTIGYEYGTNVPANTVRNFFTDADFSKPPNTDPRGKWYEFNQTFGSTFIGANNAQLSYNTDVSRFEWKFFHQPKYSDFSVDPNSGATTGGQIVSRIWTENIQGYDNWDRYGGINVENWCIPIVSFGQFQSRREVEEAGKRPLIDQDPIGKAFMNKLGFSAQWITDHSGSTDYDDVANYSYKKSYKPLGTTASDYDVSEAKPYTQPSLMYSLGQPTGFARNVNVTGVDLNSTNNIGKSIGAPPSSNDLSTDTASYYYNGAQPYGTQKPTGASAVSLTDPTIKSVGATSGYGLVSTTGTPQSVTYQANNSGTATDPRVPTNLNLDDVKFFSYDIQTDSNALTADELPKKTIIGYFLIMSDIIDKHEFLGSANNGSPLNCIGILSKNYENNDFYFSFQSPVEFHIKQDRTITSIRTQILTPALADPAGLDYNSSIIYTILRPQSIPEPDVPPIAVQQALDYAVMEQMTKTLGIDQGQINPYSSAGQLGLGQGSGGGAGLNSLRQNLVNAVLHPDQGSASMIFATQSAISQNISRMPLHQRSQMLQEGLSINPDDPAIALVPTPAKASMEGLGITQPASQTVDTTEYLSEAQLHIQEANLMKGKAVPPSESGFGGSEAGSVFSFMGGAPAKPQRQGSGSSTIIDDYLDEPSTPTTPLETKASRMRSQAQFASLPLGQFFAQHVAGSKQGVRDYYKGEQEKGMDAENPNTWSLDLLNSWSKNDFNWGDKLHKSIGGKLNLEGRTKISQAKDKLVKLGGLKERQQAITDSRKSQADLPKSMTGRTKEAVGERTTGNESLTKRISRSIKADPTTSSDEKHYVKDWNKQNPYDLRTWTAKNLKSYKTEDGHHGVHPKDRTPDNKLNQSGYNSLITEEKRRADGNKKKMNVKETGEYSNAKQAPAGYDAKVQHATPHPSTK